jgi:predicted SnoaL-like aldol condensation-catalyzing enzyme
MALRATRWEIGSMNAMSRIHRILAATFVAFVVTNAQAQVTVVADANHKRMLASPDARLAANKRLVYDFWREVFEAGHMEFAGKYMAEGYIQHNPNVPTGRAAFIEFFSKNVPPHAIETTIKTPLVAILADGDLVVLVFVRELPDPKDSAKKYTTTWFDMFRIEDGKIAEHWDAAIKRP